MPRKRIQRGSITIRWPNGQSVKLAVDEREVSPESLLGFFTICDETSAAMFASYEKDRATRPRTP